MMLETSFENLKLKAGGLNHFSVLLEAEYLDTGKDAYPDIKEKAPAYFERLPELGEILRQLREAEAGSTPGSEPALRPGANSWPERGLFKEILNKFGYLPITTDSHFGEYIHWAHDVADHKGIMDFFRFYTEWLSDLEPQIELKLSERVVPIMEGILTDSGYEEAAVNIPNNGLINTLPDFIAVEVPAIIDKDGVHGVSLGEMPKGISGLLHHQVGVHDLTAEAIITGSREYVLQALLLDPVVDKVVAAENMLDVMLDIQADYLGYIK